MPNKTSNKIETKNFNAKMKRLENKVSRLNKCLQSLYQQKSSKDIQRQIRELQNEIVENEINMTHLKAMFEKENFRRKHCKVASNLCPICPLRLA